MMFLSSEDRDAKDSLYMYSNGNASEITSLIKALKSANTTLSWTTKANAGKTVELQDLITVYPRNTPLRAQVLSEGYRYIRHSI